MSPAASSTLRVCEFYSGIGGYHIALSQIPHLSFEVAAAFEISSNANCVYRANFPNTTVLETNLCGLTATRLDSIIRKSVGSDSQDEAVTSRDEVMFVMSPPCQPFTRQGIQKDDLDPRSESVLHLFETFSQLTSLPDYFILENVRGFETSNTRNRIMQFFTKHQYRVAEFLINSNQVGIPNSRLRYYLLARKEPFTKAVESALDSSQGFHKIPRLLTSIPGFEVEIPTQPLSEYLEPGLTGYDLSDKFLSKWGWVLDLVTPSSTRSCCFTKGYSVKAEGSGSVLQQLSDPSESVGQLSLDGFSGNGGNNERSMCNSRLSKEEFLEHMKSLRLRFFSPREIARIHGIPDSYSFPEVLSEKQLYKLLGNGLNVSVVRLLIEKVLLE
ncbi:hypothetical protein ACHWQZ_G003410 [Mnemiopsis leidyi]